MPAISALSDVTFTPIASGLSSSSALNTIFTSFQSAIADLNDVTADLEKNYAGASAPTDNTVRGKLWADTTTAGIVMLYLDPDGAGADDQVLTENTAYLADLATAGTATFRLGGPIHVDTATYTKAGTTGVLATYTLPGGTLARDGQYIHLIAWGTKTGTAATIGIGPRLGGSGWTAHIMSAPCTDWYIEGRAIRTGAATQDWHSLMILNRDDTGSTTLTDSGTDTKTLSGDLAIDINIGSINASDTAKQEGFIIEFGNY